MHVVTDRSRPAAVRMTRAGVTLAAARREMQPRILVAAPSPASRRLAAAVSERFDVMLCRDPARAGALLRVGDFAAVVTVEGFLDDLDHPAKTVVAVDASFDPHTVEGRVDEAIERRRSDDRRRAGELASIALITYGDYIKLARHRAIREYLLALLAQHDGNITDAAQAADLARESLHRLLRHHDVDGELFRARVL